jgi:DNA-binding Lrp family transcriptional regulator
MASSARSDSGKERGQESLAGPAPMPLVAPEMRHIDDVDYRILTLLAQDARQSARSIARQLSMSPGAITERIARLESNGVITGYHASIDVAVIGYPMTVLIGLRLRPGQASLAQTIERLMGIRNVQSVSVVTGDWDLMAKLVVADTKQLKEILVEHIWECPGVDTAHTMTVLDYHERPGSWAAR